MFAEAFDAGIMPMDFVNDMRKQGKLILGIGHRVKSVCDPNLYIFCKSFLHKLLLNRFDILILLIHLLQYFLFM